jgi:hypothetical protein
MQAVLGPDHPNTLRCRANLAMVLGRVGPAPEAELGQLTELLRRRIGDDHPSMEDLRHRRFMHRVIDPHQY